MQHGLLYFPINTHGFSVSAILNVGATWLFVSYELARKLPATIQPMIPLTVMLPMGKTLIANSAI